MEGGFSSRDFLSTVRRLRPACSYARSSTPDWPKNWEPLSRTPSEPLGSSPLLRPEPRERREMIARGKARACACRSPGITRPHRKAL
jgi:hypothetical protein